MKGEISDGSKCHPESLLFLVRSGTTSAENSDDHHYHDGDDPNRHYDDEKHVAIQGRGRTSMGTITACGAGREVLFILRLGKDPHQKPRVLIQAGKKMSGVRQMEFC